MSKKGINLKPARSAPAIGIDLGTTYTVVAACREGKVDVIANDIGSRTTPSVVGFMNGLRFVGLAARGLALNEKVYDAKRLLGRPFVDADIQKSLSRWPFTVVELGGTPRVQLSIDGKLKTLAPEEISAAVLAYAKQTAEAFLEAKVSKAVITIPAYFNERQRQATKDAGKMAGLDVIGMINGPTAAAIAYGLEQPLENQTVFIFDLGGGTFDVSIIKINKKDFTVVASDGDSYLGGQDFNVRLVNHFLQEISSQHRVDVSGDKAAVHDLRVACEVVKRELSKVTHAPLKVYFPRYKNHHESDISRATFDDLCIDLFKRTIQITKKVLTDVQMTPSQIDSVVLVGGSTRIPKVRSLLQDVFPGKELKQCVIHDRSIAFGAAAHAAVLTGDVVMQKMVVLKDVTPLSQGVDVVEGRFSVVIPRNTPIPCKKTSTYYTVYDQQMSITGKDAMWKALSSETTIADELLTLKHTINVPVRLLSVGVSVITPWFSNDRMAQEDLHWRIILGTRPKKSSRPKTKSVYNREVFVQVASFNPGNLDQENFVDVRTTRFILLSVKLSRRRGLDKADEYDYHGDSEVLKTGTLIKICDIEEASNLSLSTQGQVVTIVLEIQLLKFLMQGTLEKPINYVQLSQGIGKHCKTILNQMLEGGAFTDVILKFGKEAIKAHRVVLSANSPVFATLLKDHSAENQIAEVAIKDIRPEVMQVAIQHMYGMDVKGLDSEMYMELLRVADEYQMSTLKSTCEDFLMRDGSVDVLKVLVAAEDFNAARLKDNILERVLKHPSRHDLLKDETLNSIVFSHPKLVANLLKTIK